jgi:cobalt-zinc-cadmium efflux system outer membrane protein
MRVLVGERAIGAFLLAVAVLANTSFAQTPIASVKTVSIRPNGESNEMERPLVASVISNYYNQTDGISLSEIVKRALENNGEIKIARLDIDKARARLTQARLRPNPTLEVQQTSGRLAGSPGDHELGVELSLPLNLYGQRGRRIDLANAEITLKEAEVAARQRLLASQIFVAYAEVLAALRELQVLEELLELDTRTVQFVQIRVNEGETSPLELNLLQTEVERLRARRQLVEGKLQAAISKLKFYAGVPFEEPLKMREEISTASIPLLPATIETSIAVGLKNRPEIRLAELDEQLAGAGLRLIRAQSGPDVTAFSRYTQGRSTIDLPAGTFPQQGNRSLTFGVSIELPVFNRNQGAKAEAQISIRQAQERRAFAEQVVKNEVIMAFQRIEAARRALSILETAVLPRSRQNTETIRKVYEIGELRITDLIVEQRSLLDANRDLTDTLTERYRAQADLFIALGITFEN